MRGLRRSGARLVAGFTVPVVVAVGLVVLPTPASAEPETFSVPSSRVFALDGRGFGHGRGMSQWGAQGGALLGRSFEQILDFYYPGTAMPARPEAAPLRVVLTRLGEEGRRPVGPADRRYECDATGAAACDLRVYAAAGLTLADGGGPPALLPASVAGAPVDRWAVVNEPDGLRLRALAGGDWRDSRVTAGPLVFGGPQTLLMAYADGSAREYRGQLSAIRTSASTMARVNVVPRELYLRGVVPKEVSPGWQSAALQAQSVAARSYADNYRAGRAGSDWDICDSTFCQVYAGRAWTAAGTNRALVQEATSTDAAIAATRDLVRTFGGTTVRAEFSASNGGWTAPGGSSWMPGREDPWDSTSGNGSHRWTGSLPASALEARFAVGTLTAIVVHSRDGNGEWGGRVGDVELRGVGPGGATSVRTTGDAVRSAYSFSSANPTGVRSSWWRIRPEPSGEVGGAWSGSPGTSELSWRRPDGQIGVGTWSASSGMSSELTLGGAARGGPAIAGRRSGALEVVVRGTDDQLWASRRPAGGSFTAWQPLGGVLTGRPAVAQFLGEELHVFVRGADGALWHRWSTAPGQWSPWEWLGGALAPGTGPAAVSTRPGGLEVVVQGTDSRAWRLTYANGWSGWTLVGGVLKGDPTVTSTAGELTLVVNGVDQPYTTTIDAAGAVAPWTPLGGQLASSPAAASVLTGGRLDVFGTGTDAGFHVNTFTSGWSGWRRIA